MAIERIESSELSFYFERLLRDEQAAGVRDATASPRRPTPSSARSRRVLARRILFGLVAKRLLESLHLSDGRELKVIDRGQPYAYRWQSVYGRAETWIPLANITAVDWDWGRRGEAAPGHGHGRHHAPASSAWVFTPDNPTLGQLPRGSSPPSATATRR